MTGAGETLEADSTPHRRGLMLVLSSPSGAGKSTLTRRLLEIEPDLQLSISMTTRQRRRSELDGRDYCFISSDEFERLEAEGAFLECATVHGNRYGTLRAPVEEALGKGRDIVFDIDWQGTQQIARQMPDDIVRVFILPPSITALRSRLERRAEDDHVTIERRLAKARDEIRHWPEYDYVVVNDDLSAAFAEVRSILAAERERRSSVPKGDVEGPGGVTPRAARHDVEKLVGKLLAG